MSTSAAAATPLDAFRWISQAGLPSAAERTAYLLLRMVRGPAKRGAWTWDRVSVGQLADELGYSRRHVRRQLRLLEGAGVLRTTHRPWATSVYELLPHGLQRLAEGMVTLAREVRERLRPRRSAATADGLVDLVLGELGEELSATYRASARRVIRLWREARSPSHEEHLEDWRLVRVALEECTARPWRLLRGDQRGGSKRDRNLWAGERWAERVRAARAHADGTCGCQVAEAREDEAMGPPPGEVWIPEGQELVELCEATARDPAGAWRQALEVIRAREGQSTAEMLGRLRARGVEGGVLVLEGASADCSLAGEVYLDAVVEAARAPVGLVVRG